MFAKIPTRCGVSFSFERLSRTSARRDEAILAARIVLQAVGGGAWVVVVGVGACAGAWGFVSWGEVVDMVGEVV